MLPRKADPESDVDFMVVFSTDEGQLKPQTYLDRLRRFAEKWYSTSEVAQSHPTIVLSLNHIRFELVPAINRWGYKIPSPASSWTEWMDTDPHGFKERLQQKNRDENYQIKPLIRLVKYWNALNGRPLASFDIEVAIVGKWFFLDKQLKEYFYTFWSWFSCPYSSPQYVRDKVEAAKNHVEKAKELESNDRPASAESEIKKVVPSL